jgi:protein-disulfide isomerase
LLPLLFAAVCLGQATWQTVVDLPGVDWSGLTGAKKQSALRAMQTEQCTCGCSMKLAECRVKDPSCATSRKLCGAVVKQTAAGKDAVAIHAELVRIAGEPPSVLDEPVKINTAGDPMLGPANARITIVEFSDFECPYCWKAAQQVKEVVRQMPGQVKLYYKQFPLDIHSQAEYAAEASLAAQAQGKFWEMHDLLYAGFPQLYDGTPQVVHGRIRDYAKQLNLDLKRFDAEMAAHKYQARARAEEQEGEVAGVSGTPSFFFNGRKYNGPFDAATVVALLKKEMK